MVLIHKGGGGRDHLKGSHVAAMGAKAKDPPVGPVHWNLGEKVPPYIDHDGGTFFFEAKVPPSL